MRLSRALSQIPKLSLLTKLALKRKINIFLIGGFLRDIYLNAKAHPQKKEIDFDFSGKRGIFSLAGDFARKIGGKIITLDKKERIKRVIYKVKDKVFTYDFSLLKGANIKEDIFLRDFSINALVVNLREKKKKVIDYCNSQDDLKKKNIRCLREDTFFDDPLRILRAFSFAANLGFRIEKNTLGAIKKYRKYLKNVSSERIGDEFFNILNSPASSKVLKIMAKAGVLDVLIPYLSKARGVKQGGYHHLDVWEHSFETLRQFELMQKRLFKDEDIFNYFQEEVGGWRKRLHIVKFACLLHDIGKPFARKKKHNKTIFHTHEKIGRDLAHKIAGDFSLSLREREMLKKLIFWHLRPGYLADMSPPSRRAVYRYFRDAGDDAVAIIFLSIADWRATRGPLTDSKKRRKHERILFELVDNYFKEKKKRPFKRLVDGYWVMRKFKIPPSELVGNILKRIEEEQALGKISTKQEAYALAKTIIASARKKN